jgi:putative addiction module antidote
MFALKIRKIGNSLGIVLPKEALSRLKVAAGGTVYMTDSKDGAFRLTALNEKFPDQMEEAERIMREDRDVLHELAGR